MEFVESKAAGNLLAVRRAHRPGHQAAPAGGTYRHEAGERTHGNASGAGPANRRCERSHPSASSCRARPAPTGRGCAALAGIATDLDASAPPIDRDEEWHCPGLRPAHSRAVAPLGGNSGLRALWAWCRSWMNATKKNRKTHSVDAQPERALNRERHSSAASCHMLQPPDRTAGDSRTGPLIMTATVAMRNRAQPLLPPHCFRRFRCRAHYHRSFSYSSPPSPLRKPRSSTGQRQKTTIVAVSASPQAIAHSILRLETDRSAHACGYRLLFPARTALRAD